MQEFAAISVSTYDPDSLVAQLNERSTDGWSVVAIVPTGSTVTAYLSREASDTATQVTAQPTAEPAVEAPAESSISADAADGSGDQVDGWAASTAAAAAAITPEPAAEPTMSTSTPEPQPAAAPAATTSAAAPAGWYADPSSRYELRYWDGSTWTEHVSRGGQQFTDPPVA